jgi:hypothetical protein
VVRCAPAAVLLATCVVVESGPGCSGPPAEPLTLRGNVLTVDNRSSQEWRGVEIWINTYYRVTTPSIPPKGRFQTSLDNFVAGFGQRFLLGGMRVRDVRLTARLADGTPIEIKRAFGAARR